MVVTRDCVVAALLTSISGKVSHFEDEDGRPHMSCLTWNYRKLLNQHVGNPADLYKMVLEKGSELWMNEIQLQNDEW